MTPVDQAGRLAAIERALGELGELLRDLAEHQCGPGGPGGVQPAPEPEEPRTTAGADALAAIENRWGPAAPADRVTTEDEEQK